MRSSELQIDTLRKPGHESRGFTLIELLTVIAIIALLIGLLVPSLTRARDAAKNVKTKVIFKDVGDALEMFRGENPDELSGESYPASRAWDDPTEEGFHVGGPDCPGDGSEDVFGAQWLVRYLMGKRLDGYVAARSVPAGFFSPAPPLGWEQKGWYDNPGDPNWPRNGPTAPLPRSGPYLQTEQVKPKAPKELPGSRVPPSDTSPKYNNPVLVDAWDVPILYYAADVQYARKPNANIATPVSYSCRGFYGIYTYKDNALFTGLCEDGQYASSYPFWDYGNGKGPLEWGPSAWENPQNPPVWNSVIGNYPHSFPYYIMNKEVFQATGGTSKGTVTPCRRDAYLLISPGKDTLFGTSDDITNF